MHHQKDYTQLKKRKCWNYWNSTACAEISKSKYIKDCRKKLMQLNKETDF